MRKVLITVAAILATLAVVAGIMTISYINSKDYTSDVFPEGTSINGINCSGLTYSQAADKLSDEWNNRHIQVVGSLGETLADYTDYGCSYNIDGYIESVKSNHLIQSSINHYLHIPFNATVTMKINKADKDFVAAVKNSEFLHRVGVTETKDAYVDLDDPDFPIIPEVYGTKANPEAFAEDLLHAIEIGLTRFEYNEDTYIAKPDVKDDDPELIKYQKFCRKYLNQKISYEFGNDTYLLTPQDLAGLMDKDLSGKADPEAINSFIVKLKEKYDIADGEVTFQSLTGKTFKVARGDNIWVIDAEGEALRLAEDINSHKDVSREPVYSSTGTGKYSTKLDVADTYVDVDITEQHVCYFENGKKKFECDCVTGCVAAGHSTPTGAYHLGNKGRNITLVGGGKKGSKGYYESFVRYWMAFIGNSIGLHDASWRDTFGGDIYKYSGSHGCVNLPPSKTGELYDLLKLGTPVIVHF